MAARRGPTRATPQPRRAWVPARTLARRFSAGDSSEIRCATGSCNIPWGTIACYVRRTQTESSEQWIANYSSANTLTGAKLGMEPGVDGNNPRGWTTNTHATFNLAPGDGWAIVAMTKATGVVTPRAHGYIGGSWQHADTDATAGDAPTTTATVRFGVIVHGLGWTPFDIAAAAMWDVVLSDAQIEELSPTSLQAWYDNTGGTPVGLWGFNQASTATPLEDLTGNGADETFVNGTAVIGDGPANLDYSVTAAVEELPIVTMAHWRTP